MFDLKLKFKNSYESNYQITSRNLVAFYYARKFNEIYS